MKYRLEDLTSIEICNLGTDFITSPLSLRKFAEKYCDFSYITLRNKLLYILPDLRYDLYLKVLAKLDNTRAKNIKEDKEAQKRVWQATQLLLEHDMTIPDIARLLNTTDMTIYRDLTVRLFVLESNPQIKKEVLERLKAHSINNLIKGAR